MSIKVITPGMLSTIQDGGRKGFAAMGFNASGVMDVRSYHIANALVGNFTDEAVIEMTYLGGSFKFLESNYIAITGADMSPKLDGVPVEMYTTVFVKQDETLTFSAAKSGMRAYIAVRGGIDVPVIMEGHVYDPESAMKSLYLGCYAVVVGSAITRPHFIVKRFTDLLNKFPKDSNWRDDERAWQGPITKLEK